jgi:flagellum-specific ATP synthase
MAKVDGGRLFARALKREGVEQVFVLSGGHVMPIFYGCRAEEIKVIDCRHEMSAAYAADAYARVTGKAGVVITTAGPGVTDTITAIAEYFRDQGYNVLLMMDSVTRYAMAQREIGLAVGEPPTTKGYTPSVFAMLPKLLERAGNFENASITGLYTVLVDGDDMNEPIADAVRGILDGHIILSREIAAQNCFPAIDIMNSISRLMPVLASEEQQALAARARNYLALYHRNQDLINIGAYKKGSNEEIDKAIALYQEIRNFLQQGIHESFDYNAAVSGLYQALGEGESN